MSEYVEFAEAIRKHYYADPPGEPGVRDGAVALLTKYFDPATPFTGSHFERFADSEHPNEITERDIVAVSMLGVEIPPNVAIWLRSEEGRSRVSALLSEVPPDALIGSHGEHLDPGSPLDELWDVLGEASWPEARHNNGMGRTKKSKLLAAKRPGLVPVLDDVVTSALPPVDNYWDAFRYTFDDETMLLSSIYLTPRPERVSVLRAVDIVLWMSHRRAAGG